MANRRGTFLSDEMTKMHCREYGAYPLGYAAANSIGNFQNSRLKGIKPSRHQRLPPRPSSIDVAAVAKAKGTSNPYLAATIIAMQEQEKIIEERKRPVQINEPLTARQLYIRYGKDNNLLAGIGRTQKEVMRAFRPDKFDLQESQDIRDEISEYYQNISRGVSLVRPVVMSDQSRADQLLEQIKGIRTDVKNMKLSQQRTNTADRSAIAEKLLTFRQNLDSASKDNLIFRVQDYIYRYGLAEQTPSSLQAMNIATLKNRLENLERKRLEGLLEEIQSVSNTPDMLNMFKRNYENLSTAEKDNTYDLMIDEIKIHLGITEDDELENTIGQVTIDNLIDYIKNNNLPLPYIDPTEQLSGVGVAPMQMQPLTEESQPEEETTEQQPMPP